ncbi:MAG: ATP-dependent RecD-like DNA helicase [Herpetosiphonaceae bacterium]|nr:ATP-dependent RecD-like DNA helicase [Herpetosiphonaceae bacterium]
MPILTGSLERITFHNPDTGYTVARLQLPGKKQLVTVVGKFMGVQVGETLQLDGDWTAHPSHGRQFQANHWESVLPADIDGIRKYLGSGLIKGIGPVMAQRIVDVFGAETLQVIESRPRKLYEVPGIGRKRIDDIVQAWHEQRDIKALMALLQTYEITPVLAIRIYRAYGERALEVVQQTPYRLSDEIFGIDFESADQIAQTQGVRHDDPWRVGAGLRHVLTLALSDGHCYLPLEELVPRAAKLLQVGEERVRAVLAEIDVAGEIQLDEVDGVPMIYLLPFYRAELGVANAIRAIQFTPSAIAQRFRNLDWQAEWQRIQQAQGIELTSKQQEAIKTVLTTKLCVLTGGPGTGKTQTTRTIIDLLNRQRCRYVLASPTGRAAKRLSEASGAEAKTIHRLLEYSPATESHFRRDRDNPLLADMVVIDEASMLDILLCNNLLKAVPPEAHVLFVGDADQLPSVGPGNVLRDLIDSWAVPTVHLDVIFRQAADSGIITSAHKINHGQVPALRGQADFFFFPRPTPELSAEMVVELVAERIPRRFGIDRQAIQVLVPMHRGPAGVQALNGQLQAALNPSHPDRPEKSWGTMTLRVGDRVMQVRNNYDLDVYNGDVGEVVAVDREAQTLTVRYDEVAGARLVVYEWSALDELQLAYAMSIHKSQGAEYPVVVLPLVQQHWALLQRNLLYTAVTRAKSLVVLVGEERAIVHAVHNHTVDARFTGLGRRLRVGG